MGAVVTTREADADDARAVFEWRNDPQTRAASGSTDPIDWADHLAWFDRSLASSTRRILIAQDDAHERVGMVRFDIVDAGAEVSINLNPLFRGRGLGGDVLRAGIEEFEAHAPGTVLLAMIRATNSASIRLFESTGFVLDREADGLLRYRRTVS